MISSLLENNNHAFDEKEDSSINGVDVASKRKENISANRVDLTPNRSLSSAHGDCGEWFSLGGERGQLGLNQPLMQLNVPKYMLYHSYSFGKMGIDSPTCDLSTELGRIRSYKSCCIPPGTQI
jgi:hypothetical protein